MAFLEDIVSGLLPYNQTHVYEGAELAMEGPAFAEPVTSDDIIEHLKLPSGNMEAAKLVLCAKAARLILERKYNIVTMDTEYVQTYDAVARILPLMARPVISITEVAFITQVVADTWIPIDSSHYSTPGVNLTSPYMPQFARVFTRTAWPAHRGYKSFRVRFHAGFKDKGAADAAAVLAAQAAVPADLKTAIMTLAGTLYESREGGPIESDAIRNIANEFNYTVKNLPAIVAEIMEQFVDWSL